VRIADSSFSAGAPSASATAWTMPTSRADTPATISAQSSAFDDQ